MSMRYSICNETFQGWDWEPTCRHVARAGYEGIEIAPFTLAPDVREIAQDDRTRIRSAAEANGLAVVGLHWLLVSPKGLSVTSPDPDLRRRTTEYLVALTQFCADIGGGIMVFGSPAQRRIEDGDTYETAAQRYRECLLPALDLADEHGITLCIEPLPQPEANFILTLDEAAEIIAQLGHPAAATILDVKSASSEGRPIPELVERHARLIAHVHANDANRRGPGFGDTDFRPILAALKRNRYDGFVSVEVFDYSPDPETIASKSIQYMKECEL
ncbi:MAG: sugar phosphate isomerase/epimerase [Chthonomonadales bacterium]|nr:sugar phosphate isomerase/epimerase [Chthonomonadales bacterium]